MLKPFFPPLLVIHRRETERLTIGRRTYHTYQYEVYVGAGLWLLALLAIVSAVTPFALELLRELGLV